jgi:hypothetical protein
VLTGFAIEGEAAASAGDRTRVFSATHALVDVDIALDAFRVTVLAFWVALIALPAGTRPLRERSIARLGPTSRRMILSAWLLCLVSSLWLGEAWLTGLAGFVLAIALARIRPSSATSLAVPERKARLMLRLFPGLADIRNAHAGRGYVTLAPFLFATLVAAMQVASLAGTPGLGPLTAFKSLDVFRADMVPAAYSSAGGMAAAAGRWWVLLSHEHAAEFLGLAGIAVLACLALHLRSLREPTPAPRRWLVSALGGRLFRPRMSLVGDCQMDCQAGAGGWRGSRRAHYGDPVAEFGEAVTSVPKVSTLRGGPAHVWSACSGPMGPWSRACN